MNNNRLPILSLILIIPLSITSWVLIHLLAIFGIFLAVAYPMWWLFAPKQTVCLLCRAEKEGAKCPFCRKEIIKNQGLSPKSLSSAIFNGGLILAFSIISIGIVFGESQLLFKFGFPPTPKTVSFVIPSKGEYRLGEIFPMKIEISGIKTPINSVRADIGFDSSKVEVVDMSTKDSFANVFIQKEINNQAGYARLVGGLPNPGFFSDHGLFGTVYFKGKSSGLVQITFLPTSLVLANDGRGSDVLKDFASVSYLILPEKVSQQEEDLQKSVILGANVLGANTHNPQSTQITFFDESSVLGAQTASQIHQVKETNTGNNLISSFLNFLGAIDKFIISSYQKLLLLKS